MIFSSCSLHAKEKLSNQLSNQQKDVIKKKIGVMPDNDNLYLHMNFIQFLTCMSKLKGSKEFSKDIYRLLEMVGLKGNEKQKIKNFSFGMKKKISIAQALLGEPELIILDEPTSGLDPDASIAIQKLIGDLKTKGTTVFLTSHNLDEIERIYDRVAIMDKGSIKKIGTVQELKNEYNSIIKIEMYSVPLLN